MSMSEQAAVPRAIRPRVEAAPGAEGAFGHPHLLERLPAVRGALRSQQPAAVVGLEAEIHLQATPVRRPAVAPGRLVAVDAEPGLQVRRMLRLLAGRRRAAPPERDRTLDVADVHLREDPAFGLGQRPAHQALPVPGRALEREELLP